MPEKLNIPGSGLLSLQTRSKTCGGKDEVEADLLSSHL